MGGLGDLFGQFFGGGGGGAPGGRSGPAPNYDIESTMQVSFEEALRGGKTQVTLPGSETVRISIPEGVEDGQKVRLRGRGSEGPGGQRGDLYITFNVAPSARFRRSGNDLTATETINVAEAMLGTTRTITTAYGDTIKVTIPPGTQPGERLRLRGQGVKTNDASGALYVEIEIAVPRSVADEAALRAWAESEGLITPGETAT